MTDFALGVAGVGAIGQNHARVLASLPGVELAAIYDTDPARAAEIAARHGTRAVTTLGELAAVCDAVTIATPTVTHYDTGRFLLEQGRHILIEKPITDNTEQAQELAALAKERGLVLQVGHIERFNLVLSLIEERLTQPRFIEAHRLSPFPNRSTDIGVVLDLMIHDLEIILHLVKNPVESMDAVGIPVLTRREDIANGCVANVTASRISPDAAAQAPRLSDRCLSLARLPGTGGKNPPAHAAGHRGGGGDGGEGGAAEAGTGRLRQLRAARSSAQSGRT